jgi:peroxiredoxin (alkyl hydroperoxide reductase subunit C)
MVDVGQPAPDFTLIDQNRQEVTLSQYRGEKNVVLSFHVYSFTGG